MPAQPALALFLLLAAPLAAAEEITLTYTPVKEPAFARWTGVRLPQEGRGDARAAWKEGAEILTERAVTVRLAGMLFSIDRRIEGDLPFDTLYLDLDENESIDPGERFGLRPFAPESGAPAGTTENPLFAAQVPAGAGAAGGKERFYRNIGIAHQEGWLGLSVSAWGCLQGRGRLHGREVEAVLEDRNGNGSFCDFQEKHGFGADRLVLSSGSGSPLSLPLRRRVLAAEGALAVDVDPAGARLSIEPLEVEMGAVRVAVAAMQVDLENDEWGRQTVRHGEARLLPAGLYRVAGFARMREEPYAACWYRGPEGMTVEVVSGREARLEPATTLFPSVAAQRDGDVLSLTLTMATAGGAAFRGYGNSAYSSPAGRALRGIPFTITNRAGDAILRDLFRFG